MNLNSKSTTEDTRERKYEEELLKSLHLACERILTSENNIEGLSLCIQSIFLHGLDAKHNQEVSNKLQIYVESLKIISMIHFSF